MPRRKGISPVIATVIIVAVTIAVAIAVAFWMTGIVGLFTAAEKLEIVYANAQPTEGDGWTVTIKVRNTGTTTTSIDVVMINGVEVGSSGCGGASLPSGTIPLTLKPGEDNTITISITKDGTCGSTKFTNGLSIEVKLHSTGGKEYPKLLVLP